MARRYAKRQDRARPDCGPDCGPDYAPIALDEFQRVAARLRKIVALPRGTRVLWRLVPCGPDIAGDCARTPAGNYVIRIESRLPRGYAIYLMLHEMAHVLQWVKFPDEPEDHGPGFGQCWARVYQAYFECD